MYGCLEFVSYPFASLSLSSLVLTTGNTGRRSDYLSFFLSSISPISNRFSWEAKQENSFLGASQSTDWLTDTPVANRACTGIYDLSQAETYPLFLAIVELGWVIENY